MKFNKKVLIGLLTASCVVAGTLGLAACSGSKGEKGDKGDTPQITIGENGNWFVDGVDTNVSATGSKGEDGVSIVYMAQIGNNLVVFYSDGTSQTVPYFDTDLKLGDTQVNLSSDALAALGVTYTFAPGKAGEYAVSVSGSNAKVTVGNTVVDGTHVFTLENDDSSVEIKCSTANGSTGKYTLSVGEVKDLSLTADNSIALPKNGKTVYMKVNVPDGKQGFYKFGLDFSNASDAYADYTFDVNGYIYSIGSGFTTSFVTQLKEGLNTVALAANLGADSAATLKIGGIPTKGSLINGENTLTFDEAETYYAYTYTVADAGYYALTVPAESTLCVAQPDGTVLLSNMQWKGNYDDEDNPTALISEPLSLNAGETVTFFIQVEDPNLEASYSLTLGKAAIPEVNVGDSDVEVTVTENGTLVILNATTAGTYVLTVDTGVGATIMLGDDYFDMFNKTVEIELKAGANEILLVNQNWFPADVLITLSAKA